MSKPNAKSVGVKQEKKENKAGNNFKVGTFFCYPTGFDFLYFNYILWVIERGGHCDKVEHNA